MDEKECDFILVVLRQKCVMQSHGFHLAFTAIIGLAIYQGVIAAARNAGNLDIWSGILMIAAVAILLLPLLAIPFIFGGFKAKKIKSRLNPELLKVYGNPVWSFFTLHRILGIRACRLVHISLCLLCHATDIGL